MKQALDGLGIMVQKVTNGSDRKIYFTFLDQRYVIRRSVLFNAEAFSAVLKRSLSSEADAGKLATLLGASGLLIRAVDDYQPPLASAKEFEASSTPSQATPA